MNKSILIGIIVMLLAVIFSFTILSSSSYVKEDSNDDLVSCTMEAQICPDGSAVGRVGPNCEFSPCPSGGDDIWANGGRIAGGYVEGHVNIGPTCPVESLDNPCIVPTETYTSRELVVYEADGVSVNQVVNLDPEGNYKISLGPGIYWIQIRPAGIVEGEKKGVIIVPFETKIVNFDIDTGIR